MIIWWPEIQGGPRFLFKCEVDWLNKIIYHPTIAYSHYMQIYYLIATWFGSLIRRRLVFLPFQVNSTKEKSMLYPNLNKSQRPKFGLKSCEENTFTLFYWFNWKKKLRTTIKNKYHTLAKNMINSPKILRTPMINPKNSCSYKKWV